MNAPPATLAAHQTDAAPPATADIVIVNWNAGAQLLDCLRSIAAHGGGRVGQVIVVDNGSTDGSADVDVPGLPLTVIRAGENLGFGRACNMGARQASAPFLLFFNPDAELFDGSLDGALSFMAAPGSERVGVAGVRLVDRGGHVHRHLGRLPGWRSFVGHSLGLTRALRRWFPPIILHEFDHLTSRPADHVMGAFYLIRRDLFERLGGFDEDFFVYLEDLDLSARVAAAGYETRYLADVAAYHKQGGTSEQVKAHRLFYALQSNIVYAAKHLPRAQAIGVTAVTLAVEPFSRVARAASHGSAREVRDTLSGFRMLYADLPRLGRVAWRAMRERAR